ncbi:hypothetical protein ACLKA7_015505 [Drosophila subpalustris]
MARMFFIAVWAFFIRMLAPLKGHIQFEREVGREEEVEVVGVRRQLSGLPTRCVQPQNVMHLSTGHNKMPKQLCGFGLTNKPSQASGQPDNNRLNWPTDSPLLYSQNQTAASGGNRMSFWFTE